MSFWHVAFVLDFFADILNLSFYQLLKAQTMSQPSFERENIFGCYIHTFSSHHEIFENCWTIFGWISSGQDNGIRLPGSIRHISKTRLDHHQNIFWRNCLHLELKCCQKILTDLGGRIEFVENSETFQWDFE